MKLSVTETTGRAKAFFVVVALVAVAVCVTLWALLSTQHNALSTQRNAPADSAARSVAGSSSLSVADTAKSQVFRAVDIATLQCGSYSQNRATGFRLDDRHILSVAHAFSDVSAVAVKVSGLWYEGSVVHADLNRDIAIIGIGSVLDIPSDTAADGGADGGAESVIGSFSFRSESADSSEVLWMLTPPPRQSTPATPGLVPATPGSAQRSVAATPGSAPNSTPATHGSIPSSVAVSNVGQALPVEIRRAVTVIVDPVKPSEHTGGNGKANDSGASESLAQSGASDLAQWADRGKVRRSAYELDVDISKGDSGSVLLDSSGAIAAMVFARSTQSEGRSWAVDSSELAAAYADLLNQPTPIVMCPKLADSKLELD